jgi:hypothetical protein
LEKLLLKKGIRVENVVRKIPPFGFIFNNYREPRWIFFVIFPAFYFAASVVVLFSFKFTGIWWIFGQPAIELFKFSRDTLGIRCAPGDSSCLLEMATQMLSLGMVLAVIGGIGYVTGWWMERKRIRQ